MRQHVHPLPALRFPFDLGMRLDLKQGDDPIYLSDLYVSLSLSLPITKFDADADVIS